MDGVCMDQAGLPGTWGRSFDFGRLIILRDPVPGYYR